MGLSSTLAISANALEAFTAGLHVTGQNVANASTPGYVREQLQLVPGAAYLQNGMLVGTGVLTDGTRQQIDLFLEARIHTANSGFLSAQATAEGYTELETQLRELGDADLSTGLNDFLGALHDLSSQPDSESLRELAVEQGELYARQVRSFRSRIDEMRELQSDSVSALVEEANRLIDDVAELNEQIVKLEAQVDSDAGGHRSRRYEALNRLSEILPVEAQFRADGSVDLFLGSEYLILSGQKQNLETYARADHGLDVLDVRTTKTKFDVSRFGGELGGTIAARDDVLGGFVDDLDTYAANVIYEFNRIHAAGEGLAGFTSVTSHNAVSSTTADLNSTAAGLPFTPTHGSFDVKLTDQNTGQTVTSTIDVDLDGVGADDGLDDLRTKLDGVANLSATITADNRLQLSTAGGYEVTFSGDTSGALAALGINTFFSGTDSGTIGVDPVVRNDTRYLATGRGGGPADGSNLVEMVDFSQQAVSGLNGLSVDQFYEATVSRITQASASQSTIADGLGTFRTSLKTQREQLSGVSLDEEAVRILNFQHGFQAAARMISTVDELFSVLVNL